MRSLITYFIKYPIAGNLLLILTLIFGFFGMNNLRKTFFPEFESRVIQIQAVYPGSSPSEIEEGIVLKIEDNLDGLSGIERITSSSQENLGSVKVEVNKDYDTEIILQDVKNAVDRINSFPDGMEPPTIYIREQNETAISFSLSGNLDIKELKHIARRVENDLKALDGISKVELSGFPEEEIEIRIKDDELRKYSVTIDQISNAIKRDNLELTGGILKTPTERILIRSKNKNFTALEIGKTIIKTLPSQQIIRLNDIADVVETWEDIPNKKFFKGTPAVIVTVNHTIHEDIIDIVAIVKKYVEDFNATNTIVNADIISDRSQVLKERIDLLTNNGLVGFVLVLLFLSMFLHPRLALWVAAGIPISFAGMFIFASFYGLSINVISLFGMIIVIGILVDDGIIISENIYQHFEKGKDPIQAAIDGTLEVIPSVFSAVITTAIAFSLFFVLDGRMGEFFPQMGFVVIATLLFSLVEGIFILPAHIGHSKALTREKKNNIATKIIGFFTAGLDLTKEKLYRPGLEFSLKYPVVVLTICISLLALTITGISSGIIKLTVFPSIESDFLMSELTMPPGTSEVVTETWINNIEEKIWEVNDAYKAEYNGKDIIRGIEKTIGPQTHTAFLNLILMPSEERNKSGSEIINAIQKRVGVIPNAEKFTVKALGPFGRPISVALYSDDYSELENAKTMLIKDMDRLGSLENIEGSDQTGMQELNLKLKEKAYAIGLSNMEIVSEIRKAFFGQEVQRLQRGIDEVKVWIRYANENRKTIGDLEETHITIRGKEYLVKDLVTISQSRGIVSIDHIDGKRSIKIEADLINPKKDNPTEILGYIQSDLIPKILKLNPSVKYSVEGQIRDQAKTGKSAAKAGPIILLLIVSCIILTFRSFMQSAVVFFIIPFGLIGVGWGHFVHDAQISMFSWFGMIALIGVMVNDSLVFVSAMNINLKEGMSYDEAIRTAGLSRFRPIILTSLTTIGGLAPLIAETSFQAQFLVPMAIAIAYGLIVATLLTLLFLPALLKITNWLRWIGIWIRSGKVKTREEIEPAVKELKFEKMDI